MSTRRKFRWRPAVVVLAEVAGQVALAADHRERLDILAAGLPDVQTERREAAARGLPLRVPLVDGRIAVLVRYVGGRPVYAASTNLDAARTISADEVWSGGSAGLELDGEGEVLGMWDEGGGRDSHRELVPRLTAMEPLALMQHSTHVAGTMIGAGIGPQARGMASAASIRQWDFVDDLNEMAAHQGTGDPVRISNHSYTYLSGWQLGSFGFCPGDPQWYWLGDVAVSTQEDARFGLYDDAAAAWDGILEAAPDYMTVKSIGNDRGQGPSAGTAHCHFEGSGLGGWSISTDVHPVDGGAGLGWDTVAGGGGAAKNTLTVGAVKDLPGGYAGPASVEVWAASGWGPTDDGRLKPDVVANGVQLTSADSAGDALYVQLSGTSMAAAGVSGALALLRQHGQQQGLTLRGVDLKALLIHTADEAGPAVGPDYVFGWGLIDVPAAAEVLSQAAAAPGYFSTATLLDGQSWEIELWSSGALPLRATLAWIDPPAAAQDGSTVDPADPALVHQLDLLALGPQGETRPWVLDPSNPGQAAVRGIQDRDPIEVVDIGVPAPGRHRLRVAHRGILGPAGQPFAVWISGFDVDALFIDGFESGGTEAWSATVLP